jgi:hypothetical protein
MADGTDLIARNVIVIPKMHLNRISRRCHPGPWVRSAHFHQRESWQLGSFVAFQQPTPLRWVRSAHHRRRHSRDWVRSARRALPPSLVVSDALQRLPTAFCLFCISRPISRIEIVHNFIGCLVLPENWVRFAKKAARAVFGPTNRVTECLPPTARWLRLVVFRYSFTALIIRAEIFGGFVWLISDVVSSPS